MSDTKSTIAAPDTSRPWGDRSVASGVEAVFLWAKKEIAKVEERAASAVEAAHSRITAMERKMNQPAPPAAPPPVVAKVPDMGASVPGAGAGADTNKGAAS